MSVSIRHSRINDATIPKIAIADPKKIEITMPEKIRPDLPMNSMPN